MSVLDCSTWIQTEFECASVLLVSNAFSLPSSLIGTAREASHPLDDRSGTGTGIWCFGRSDGPWWVRPHIDVIVAIPTLHTPTYQNSTFRQLRTILNFALANTYDTCRTNTYWGSVREWQILAINK